MVDEPRKASDILLELETKVNNLIALVSSQGLNISVVSNKLNEIMLAINKQGTQQKHTVEAVNTMSLASSPLQAFKAIDPERQIPIVAAAKIPQTNQPDGFRRTSRPETFGEENNQSGQQQIQPQVPQSRTQKPPPGREFQQVTQAAEIIKQQPQQQMHMQQEAEETFPAYQPQSTQPPQQPNAAPKKQQFTQNTVPVIQRVINKDGKSIFLADVEITDMASSKPVFKTRTNGTGKWMASLGVGDYRVIVRKREGATKEQLQAIHELHIDGSQSKIELPVMTVR